MITIIKNGTILTDTSEFLADILIEDDKIKAIGNFVDMHADYIYNAEGCYVFAGGIDEHTHFGSFHGLSFETSIAAAVGGTTTVVDFVPQRQGQTLLQAIEEHREEAERNAFVDFAFHSMLMDIQTDVLEEIKMLPQYGVSSIKMFMAYKGSPYYANDQSIIYAMKLAKKYGITMMLHAENADIIEIKTKEFISKQLIAPYYHAKARPAIAEKEAVNRAIQYAELTACPLFIVHISTKDALHNIQKARMQGQAVFCESCTHYLVLDEEMLKTERLEGCKYICSPPLRKKEDNEALWKGIKNGFIQSISSDHCAVKGGYQRKIYKYSDFSKVANGIAGVQNRLHILWSEGVCKKRITKQEFVRVFSSRPAEICGLNIKGKLLPGYDADIVVYNPKPLRIIKKEDSLEGIDYTTYENFKIQGMVEKVFLRGKLIVEHEQYIGHKEGKFQKTKPYAYCYDK